MERGGSEMEYKLKAGDRVVVHTCLEAKNPKYFGKILDVETDQFEKMGQEVVMLKGDSCETYVRFLQKVDDPRIDAFEKIVENDFGNFPCILIEVSCDTTCRECILNELMEPKEVLSIEKWTWETENKDWWENPSVETREEAIERAKKEGLKKFVIGQCEKHVLPSVDADSILENMSDTLDDEVSEAGERWYGDISLEDTQLLENMLNETLIKWADQTKNHPSSYTVIGIEEIQVERTKDE